MARQRHKKAGALSGREGAGYRNRPTTVTRTSTHCGSPLDGKRAKLTPRFLRSKSAAKARTGESKSSSAKVQEGATDRPQRQEMRGRLPPVVGKLAPTTIRRSCRSELARRPVNPRRIPAMPLFREQARSYNVTRAISWRWPAAGRAPNGCGGLCRARTARRRFPRRGSAAPTARCRSGRGWPG